MVRASFVLPAALTPAMLVIMRKRTNNALTRIWTVGSRLGRKNMRYWVKATGKTARDIHSASYKDQPTVKPANGPQASCA